MSTSNSKKIMHPILRFLVEVFSIRAGFHVSQTSNTKE